MTSGSCSHSLTFFYWGNIVIVPSIKWISSKNLLAKNKTSNSIMAKCFLLNRVIVQLSYFSERLSSPMCPGSCLPLKRMQTVIMKQLVFWLPSWQCGAVMLMDAGRNMETSTVMTGRVLKPIQSDTGGGHWVLKRLQRKNEGKKKQLNYVVTHLSSTTLSAIKAPMVTSAMKTQVSLALH